MTQQTNRHSEDGVISDIDALINEQLAGGDCSRTHFMPLRDRCPRCGDEWHGLPEGGCPGSFAEGEEDEPANPIAAQLHSAELQHMASVNEACPVRWLDWAVVISEPDALMVVPALEYAGPPMELVNNLLNAVLGMLAEVCGIHLGDTDIEAAITALQDYTRRYREIVRRPASPVGYTLDDVQAMRRETWDAVDNRRQAVQRLRGRRNHDQAGAGDWTGWDSCTRAAMRDASAGEEEAQQDSGA